MPETYVLNATHRRILQWLRHYPFQRLEDLVMALSTWSGRTTIYTHVKELERAQFIEALKGPLCPGKYLYHLSPAGLTWYLLTTQTDTFALNEEALREMRAAERSALLRLLPRIPVLLTLQTAIHGLVGGAAATLTQQGHRAQLVQWNWQRDARHAFTYQGRTLRWFADGVGAFCLRYAPTNEGIQEQWYRFFLLYTPLTHPHLMRARLDRLLRWREAKERWLVYTQMPPILILAASERQAEWWHEAAERVTHDLGVIAPLGAITNVAHLSNRERSGSPNHLATETSLWRVPWKRPGCQSVCHLRDLFAPQDDPGFPEIFPQEILTPCREEVPLFMQEKTPMLPMRSRLYRFEHTKEPQFQRRQGQSASLEARRRACLDLTPRMFELLWLLQAHPLLDRENLCAHLHLKRGSLNHVLAPMIRAHLIACYETRIGERFAPSEEGLRLMAASAHCHVRHLVHRPALIEDPLYTDSLMPRGLPGLLKQIEHIAGVYGFFDVLTSLGCLRWWETGSICARFYRYQGNWHGIRPDAVAECCAERHTNERSWRFFVEWDRGTMHERDLRRKMEAYARYLSSREWSREHQAPPALLCVVPDVAQERALTRIALARLGDCSIHFALYTTTRNLLIVPGLSAPIWRQVMPRVRRTADDPMLLRLFSEHTTGSEISG